MWDKVPHMLPTTSLHVRLVLPLACAVAGRPLAYNTRSSQSARRPSSLPICSTHAFPWVMTCLMRVSGRPSGVMVTIVGSLFATARPTLSGHHDGIRQYFESDFHTCGVQCYTVLSNHNHCPKPSLTCTGLLACAHCNHEINVL